MKIVKRIDYLNPYTSKVDGKLHANIAFYLVADINGQEKFVAIRPAYDQAYPALDFLAERLVIGTPEDLRKKAN